MIYKCYKCKGLFESAERKFFCPECEEIAIRRLIQRIKEELSSQYCKKGSKASEEREL